MTTAVKGVKWNGMEQNRIEQNRIEQNRTEQNRTEQNRTEQNRTEQNRTEQNKRVRNGIRGEAACREQVPNTVTFSEMHLIQKAVGAGREGPVSGG